ncbi:MAG: PAS domain S-box protein, partial [Proteobacteria bacterium]|nr:PAS domain S-box protein [Pseudomonadota bacterium]
VAVMPGHEGDLSRVLVSFLDITETRRAREELARNRRELRAMVDASPDGMALLDREGRVVECNEALAVRVGRDRDELPGANVYSFLPDDLAESRRACVERVFETGEAVRFEDQRAGRSLRHAVCPVPDHGSGVEEVAIYSADITEIRQTERALRESGRRFREIAAAVPGALYQLVQNPDGSLALPFMSEGGAALLEATTDELADASRVFDHVHPDDLPGLTASMACSAASLAPWAYDFRYTPPAGGTTKWLQGRSLPHRDERGRIVWTGVLLDITARKKAEAEIRDKEARYRALLESTRTVPWALELASGKMTYMGPQAEQIFGYPVESWVDMQSWIDRVHPDDREEAVRTCTDATARGEDHAFEYRALRADGKVIWVLDEVSVVSGPGGPERLLGFMRDITAAKVGREALAESERRYRHLFEGMLEGMAVHEILTDLQGEPVDYRILDANPEFERLIGKEASQVVGKTLRELFPDGERHWLGRYGRVVATGEPMRFEGYSRALGKWLKVSAYRSQSGQLVRILTDVSTEHRAREERDRLFTRSLDLLCVSDLEGRLREVNPAWTKALGWSDEELTGRPWLDFVHPDDRERTAAEGERLRAGVFTKGFENRYRCRDGTYRWLSWNSFPVPAEGIAFSVVRDVTEARRLAEEQAQLEGQLRQAQKMEAIGTLAGGIAHDFNNILTPIVAHADFALMLVPADGP